MEGIPRMPGLHAIAAGLATAITTIVTTSFTTIVTTTFTTSMEATHGYNDYIQG